MQPDADQPGNRRGVLAGVIGAGLLVAVVAIFMFTRGGGETDDTRPAESPAAPESSVRAPAIADTPTPTERAAAPAPPSPANEPTPPLADSPPAPSARDLKRKSVTDLRRSVPRTKPIAEESR